MNPKIYLIHDSQRKDRRDLFRKELEEQGIDLYELVPADKSTNNPVRNISKAHKECIRRAVAQDLDQVVILEDDVQFVCQGAYNRFLELLDKLHPETWDIFTSGSYEYSFDRSSKALEDLKKIGLSKLRRFSGLHCYAVNKRFYQKFLQAPEGRNLDKTLTGDIWMSFPMLAVQHDGFSDNRKAQTNYNHQYKSRLNLWDGKINNQ